MREEVRAAYSARSVADLGTPDLVIAAEVAEIAAVDAPTRARPKWGVFFWICIGWLSLLAFMVCFVNFLPLQSPINPNFPPGINASWSSAHWLGTDQVARDTFSRLIWGARTSFIIGLSATAIGISIGGTLGMLSAYVRGRSTRRSRSSCTAALRSPPSSR